MPNLPAQKLEVPVSTWKHPILLSSLSIPISLNEPPWDFRAPRWGPSSYQSPLFEHLFFLPPYHQDKQTAPESPADPQGSQYLSPPGLRFRVWI